MRATPVIIQSLPDSWNNSRESFETSEGKGRFIGEGKVACKIVCEQKGEIYLAEEERDIVSCYTSPWKVALRVQTWETRKTWAKAWARCAINGGMNARQAYPPIIEASFFERKEKRTNEIIHFIIQGENLIHLLGSSKVPLNGERERIASVARLEHYRPASDWTCRCAIKFSSWLVTKLYSMDGTTEDERCLKIRITRSPWRRVKWQLTAVPVFRDRQRKKRD